VTRRVLLLRHGRTAWNAQRRFQGQADPPLDDLGRTQAYEAAVLVAALAPDLLVSSDAQRARQTAEIVAEVTGCELVLDRRFRERGLGHWEGLTREEVEARYPDEFADWVAGRDISRRGGESRTEVAARAGEGFAALPDVPTTVLVTHSATAMALTNALLGLPQDLHLLSPLANCHWSELAGTQDGEAPRWRLRGHNLGAPGTVIPRPVPLDSEDAPDAEA
jgi:glucosyl-3-phosphoglycerate phosphatase